MEDCELNLRLQHLWRTTEVLCRDLDLVYDEVGLGPKLKYKWMILKRLSRVREQALKTILIRTVYLHSTKVKDLRHDEIWRDDKCSCRRREFDVILFPQCIVRNMHLCFSNNGGNFCSSPYVPFTGDCRAQFSTARSLTRLKYYIKRGRMFVAWRMPQQPASPEVRISIVGTPDYQKLVLCRHASPIYPV